MSAKYIDPSRSEDFFQQCNDKADYLRSNPRLMSALGVIGVTRTKAEAISQKIDTLWQQGQVPPLSKRLCLS